MFLKNCREESRIIPISDLPTDTHIIVFGIVFPIVVSIFTAILFARIFGPLFLKLKTGVLGREFKNGYITKTPQPLSKKIIIRRLIFTTLLAFGLVGSIINLINVEDWLSPETICDYIDRGLDYRYHFNLFMALLGIMLPLAMGLMAVAWAIEDSGLMHYTFKDDGMFEVEPISNKYSGYLEGFAGISSVLFVIQFFSYQAKENSMADGALIFAALLIVVICFMPGYFIFAKVMKDHSYMRKGLTEIKKMKEEDLKKV